MHRHLLAAGALITFASPAESAWTPTEGPDGARVVAIEIDTTSDDVYLATGGSVFRSTDAGASWIDVGAGAGIANILGLHAEPGGTVLAGVSLLGVWWSTDQGATWDNDQITTNPHTGLGASIQGVGVATGGAWLASGYRSTNGGASWNEMTISGRDFVNVAGRTLAATSDGVHASTTNGGSWTPSNVGIEGMYVTALARDPSDRVYAATLDAGVFRSEDGGLTWVGTSNGLGSLQIADVAADGTGRLFVATNDAGVYTSTDQGATWTPTAASVPDVQATAVVVDGDDRLFAGTTAAGVVATEDAGASWTPRNEGLVAPSLGSLAFLSSGIGLAGSRGHGVYRSLDDGTSWQQSLSGLDDRLINDVVELDSGDLLAAVWSGTYRSTDGGITWATDGLDGERILDLVPSADGSLVAVAQLISGTTLAYRSIDDGVSWSPVLDAADLSAPSGMSTGGIDTDGRIFLGGSSFFVQGLVVVSEDDGASWTERTIGAIGGTIVDLAITADGTLYALGDQSGLFVSDDHGASWTALPRPWTQRGEVVELSPTGELFVGTQIEGVFRSDDGGLTWSAFSDGLGAFPVVQSIAFRGAFAFAGTASQGLFRAPLDPTVAVPPASPPPIHVSNAHPNPFHSGTAITFALEDAGPARLDVFAIDGRHVRRLMHGHRDAGTHRGTWDGRDERGFTMPSGRYLLRIETRGGSVTRRVTLLR